VSYGGGNVPLATAVAVAIGLQNMPEGLAVALPLLREKYSKGKALGYALLSGLAEPIAGIFGLLAVQIAQPILPLALAFAAGAMLFVVSDEIIPETHRKGFESEGTWGVMIGFVVMMLLDNLFG